MFNYPIQTCHRNFAIYSIFSTFDFQFIVCEEEDEEALGVEGGGGGGA